MRDSSHLTPSGLTGIASIPYGLHACHVYKDLEQLLAALVPYCLAGLRARERCIWVAAPPLPAREVVKVLRAGWPELARAIESGALVIVDGGQWYLNGATPKGGKVSPVWLREEARALAEGYRGLRVSGNVSFLTPDSWGAFIDYEHEVTRRIRGRRIVALCSYLHSQCGHGRVGDVVHSHHCAIEPMDGNWQVRASVFA